MSAVKFLTISLLLSMAFLGSSALAGGKKTVLIVKSYSYLSPEGGVSAEAEQTGHSLCGNKCNAASANFESLMMAGMRLVKTVEGKEIRVPLGNPFLKGDCLCTGDEYEIDRSTYRPGVSAPMDQTAPSDSK